MLRSRLCAQAMLLFAALFAGIHPAAAEDLSLLYGLVRSQTDAEDSLGYQLEYRKPLTANAGVSVAYLNEGHFYDHHRDGIDVEAWAVTPKVLNRLQAGLGLGAYYSFDTQLADVAPWFHDTHGLGEILSASVTYDLNKHWLARMQWSKIYAPDSFDTQTLMIGAGYRVEAVAGGDDYTSEQPYGGGLSLNEFTIFAARSIVNDRNHVDGSDLGFEYRRDIAGPFELSAAWLDEAIHATGHHSNLLLEAWLVTAALGPRFTFGLGAGPCINLQSYSTDITNTDNVQRRAGVVDALIGLTLSFQFTRRLNGRLGWHRAFSRFNDDRDIASLGLGWSWGS